MIYKIVIVYIEKMAKIILVEARTLLLALAIANL